MKRMLPQVSVLVPIALLPLLPGCILRTEHKIEPIEINMNIYLHVDQELDSFFKKIDAKDATLNPDTAKEGKTDK